MLKRIQDRLRIIFLPTKYTKSAKPFRHRQPRHEFETRLPPGSLAASRRGFAFCVADPIGSGHESARIDRNLLTQLCRQTRGHSCTSCPFPKSPGKRSACPTIPSMRGRRCLPRRLVSPEPCAKAEAPWRRRIKKFSRFKNFRELRPEFPGTDGERQTLPEREKPKIKRKTSMKPNLKKFAAALLFASVAISCSLTMWASPPVNGWAAKHRDGKTTA